MAQKNPADVASKWGTNLQNAGASIKAGVSAVTTAPGQLAAAAQGTMQQRLNDSINSGKWAQKVSAVSLSSWQNSMLTTGLQNISNGVNKGKPKMQTFLQAFLPFVSNVQQQVKAMPNATQADREARMLANSRMLGQFSRQSGS